MGGYIIKGRDINRVAERFRRAGDKERLSSPQIIQPTKAGRHNSGVRSAFCKTAAGEGTTIDAYLDTNITGDEITVNCIIAGGTDLNNAVPRLTQGFEIPVWQIGGVWKTLPFQASQDCD